MKKCFLTLAIIFSAIAFTRAQSTFGIKGGVNFSKINTNNVDESTVTGYQAGIFMRFGDDIYLQPELYVGSTGGKFDFNTGTTASGEDKVTFTTLSFPLLLGKRFGPVKQNFRVMLGPVYTFNMDKSQSFTDNVGGAYDDFGAYNKSTLGIQVGGGVDIGPITADLRYEGGLTRLNSHYGQRQNLWALSLGFKFL